MGPAHSHDQPTVLVIDDSRIILDVTRNALENAGYRVITHDRPVGCVALILQEKPDLLLMDVNMPTLSGDTIVSMFGKAQPNSETIVLLHSSLAVDALQGRAMAAGAHGFIQKSGDLFSLVRQVNGWMKRVKGYGGPSPRVTQKLSTSEGPGPHSSSRLPAVRLSTPTSGLRDSSLAPSQRPSGTRRVRPASVLLVDDEMSVLSAYRSYLQSADLSVEFALSGASALKRIMSETPPDVVVCELVMDGLSGIDVYRRAFREHASWLYRFVFVANPKDHPVVSDFSSNFSHHILRKPVDASELRRALGQCLAPDRGKLEVGSG